MEQETVFALKTKIELLEERLQQLEAAVYKMQTEGF